ncbi:MAG: hypothetical protein WKG07_06620 [Hymenobacter sp.]
MLFCGNMGYHPNVDAACFLAEEIMPLVRQQHRQARLLVAGTTPAPGCWRAGLGARAVSGWVPRHPGGVRVGAGVRGAHARGHGPAEQAARSHGHAPALRDHHRWPTTPCSGAPGQAVRGGRRRCGPWPRPLRLARRA